MDTLTKMHNVRAYFGRLPSTVTSLNPEADALVAVPPSSLPVGSSATMQVISYKRCVFGDGPFRIERHERPSPSAAEDAAACLGADAAESASRRVAPTAPLTRYEIPRDFSRSHLGRVSVAIPAGQARLVVCVSFGELRMAMKPLGDTRPCGAIHVFSLVSGAKIGSFQFRGEYLTSLVAESMPARTDRYDTTTLKIIGFGGMEPPRCATTAHVAVPGHHGAVVVEADYHGASAFVFTYHEKTMTRKRRDGGGTELVCEFVALFTEDEDGEGQATTGDLAPTVVNMSAETRVMCTAVAVSPDGRFVACVGTDNDGLARKYLSVFDITTPNRPVRASEVELMMRIDDVDQLCFVSPTRVLFLTSGYHPGCHVYDVALGRFIVSVWHGADDKVSAVVCCEQAQCELPAVVAMIVDFGAHTPAAFGGAKTIQWIEV